ncbi:peptidyl-prolyl cis-trans isomerase [Pyxidicoccus parkwayensis]|uniref:Peptidyl-prolyl cis-trans isomerase n=1 Tax=Pyxidicoccus parkwayensis TaxID=2813578 RepID=A0ABX7P6Q9_9BACT|nr:peptidyl-prolyl cis-trans isomerase [Pyxidicoccus parkwaysis]QSQ26141.1 peptidyl-prolyl cis-trans isomerase [Pyxidicoccus parkwaysis]
MASACVLLWCVGCDGQRPSKAEASDSSAVVARFEGGVVTSDEVLRESQRLPPNLRAKFETGPGRKEFIQSLVDKRLLAQEAARRGYADDPEIRRQVRELEERLTIQALLAAEEKAVAAPTEAEARAFHAAHPERFAEPERLRLARVLVSVPPGSTRAAWEQARKKAEGLRRRLVAGEPVAKVAEAGDGTERTRGGELGLLARGEFGSAAVEQAALALIQPGAVTPVVEDVVGAAVLVLLERRPARVPPFEEVRSAVLAQMAPGTQRKVFEQVLSRVRGAAAVKFEGGEGTAPVSDGAPVARQ